jgi:hypothetical protein
MNRTALLAGSFGMSLAAALFLGGCASSQRAQSAAENKTTALRATVVAAAGPYGTAPVLPKVRITCADGNYDYLYTLRNEVGGSKAEPRGSQGVDLGKGGMVPSAYRLNLERGFAVLGGCFPVAPPISDRDNKEVPPRPWSPFTALGTVGSAAQGTKYSIYIETDTNKTPIGIYLFRHSGGPVHGWTFAPGTDPQMPGSSLVIPAGASPPKYILGQLNSKGEWELSLKDLPLSGDNGNVRKYFDACDAVAQNVTIGFPSCVIPDAAGKSNQ